MGQIVPIFDETNYRRVFEKIKKLWKEGNVEFLPHAKKRLEERKLDVNDLNHLIKYGKITDHSKPEFLWRFVIDGVSVDGKKVRCVVEIDTNLIIVTVIGKRHR